MLGVDLNSVDLNEHFKGLHVAFPVTSAEGTSALATVWMKVAPGGVLPEHTDSAEEILFVVDGEVEASVGDETQTLHARELAVVPALAPHGLRNVTDRPAHVLGVFASSTNVAVFTEPHGPDGLRVFVIGAPLPLASPLEEALATA
jgi:quercetin dioxygenase-like cupin family protein